MSMLPVLVMLASLTVGRAPLLVRAQKGEVKAEVQLAISFQDPGQGRVDLEASEHWLRVAAAQGDAEGEFYLGRILEMVPGAHHDFTDARYWYKKAADQGNARAFNNLGVMADNGEGGPRDWKVAGAFYKISARLGNNFGQRNYADWLVDHPSLGGGKYSPPRVDVAQVLDLYHRSAAQNDTVAMMKLASCYKRGNLLKLPESATNYADWTRRAALAGDTNAMVSMGWACEHGYGVPKDGSRALYWNEKAAESGHLQAMTNLGILYSQGQVVPQDKDKSIAWFRRGDACGSWTSTYELAVHYRTGDGVPRDPREAAALFRKAAGYGWGQAWLGLGHLYEDGDGVQKDPARALDCYFMGARRWDAVSENNIGAFYEHGIAGTTDLSLAWCWFSIAKDEGCQIAAKNLDSLEGRMTLMDKLRVAKRLPLIRSWLADARAEEIKRLDQSSGIHS